MAEDPVNDFTLALEEARRDADRQHAELDVLRNRAVSTLGMGGLSAAFLGGLATRGDEDLGAFSVVAGLAFFVLACLCVFLLWPRRIFVSRMPSTVVSWVEDYSASQRELERDMALWMGKKYLENRKVIDRLRWSLCGVMVAFMVEVIALIADLLSG